MYGSRSTPAYERRTAPRSTRAILPPTSTWIGAALRDIGAYEYGGTITTLAASRSTSRRGEPVTFAATVRSAEPGIPTGAATITDEASTIGTVPLTVTGEAELTTSALRPGAHTLCGAYGGDQFFASSVSAPITHTVFTELWLPVVAR